MLSEIVQIVPGLLRMRRACLCTLLLLVSLPALSEEEPVGDVVYGEAVPIGVAPEPALSHVSFEMERCGQIFRTTWRNADDALLAADELEYADGTLSRYRFARPNVDEWVQVTRVGDALRIEHSENGRVRTGELSASRAIVVGPMIALIVERRLRELTAGERLQVRYAVPERFAAYDFNVANAASKVGRLRDVEVTADSWLVRQFARPVSLFFSDDGHFAGMRGRALPASGEPGRPQPLELDARVLKRMARRCSPVPRSDAWFRTATRVSQMNDQNAASDRNRPRRRSF